MLAGAPLSEAQSLLVRSSVIYDSGSRRQELKNILVADVRRAFFIQEVFNELLLVYQTDREDVVGQFIRSLHGTRDTPVNWQRHFTNHLEQLVFTSD